MGVIWDQPGRHDFSDANNFSLADHQIFLQVSRVINKQGGRLEVGGFAIRCTNFLDNQRSNYDGDHLSLLLDNELIFFVQISKRQKRQQSLSLSVQFTLGNGLPHTYRRHNVDTSFCIRGFYYEQRQND